MPGRQVLQKHPLSSLPLLYFSFSWSRLLSLVSLSSSVFISPYLSHYSNTWEPRCHTSARGFTCRRATGDEEKHIRRERLGPGATLRSGGDTRFSYTSEVWGGGGGLLRTWNSLATITSRRPACTRLSGLKRKQPSDLCPSAPLPMLRPQDRFRPASLHPGSLNWDAPARGGLIQNICEVSARGHGGSGERIPSGVCAKHCVLQVIVEGCESLREH